MSIRKRAWKTSKGEAKTAWIVDYVDGKGVRRLKTFAKKKDADAFASKADVEVREGVHVADRDTVTVEAAGKMWISGSEAAGLERSTVEAYRQRLDLHVSPFIGKEKLSKITVPAVRAFADQLRSEGRSPAMVKKAVTALGAILSDAQERGLVVRNAVKEMSRRRNGSEKRAKRLLQPGVDIPTPAEIRAFLAALDGKWRPILLTAVFSGLRSSELRGLRWQDVDFQKATLEVRQRSDKWGTIGSTKSHAGQRTVPVPPVVVNTLREWKLQCPLGELVFPNGLGNPESHSNIVNRGLIPAMEKAGLTIDTGKLDDEGNPILEARYSGLHALRHFFASWLINPKEAGGLGLDMKTVQARMGHSSIVVTADVYSHLFPRGDDSKELANAADALFLINAT
ncbi:site-specific integrase [Mesorhizobium sp.]|uniref:tyrosine-type recombinase/integrase n=1 Tax=Mesorhizobium sp. TaxID=1871066 RepID=UPI000FE5BF6F|nr:site-specific integrase [Mesorhizobium sp.]RWQ54347.1 MAG: site-specific integrase [Mesorhizobium sp.]